jgi:hypothetical protein
MVKVSRRPRSVHLLESEGLMNLIATAALVSDEMEDGT